MEKLLKEIQQTGEEIWLIINGKEYYSNLKYVSDSLVTFTYQRYSSERDAYGNWEKTVRLSLVEGFERKVGYLPGTINAAIEQLPEVTLDVDERE